MITLSEDQIQYESGEILEECHGEVQGFYRALVEHLKRLRPPDTTWDLESAQPSTLKGIAGKRRDALVVRNRRFREDVICVMASDYGATLCISFYRSGSLRGKILAILSPIWGISRLLNVIGILRDKDVFDRQDFSAWASVVRMAVDHAVKQITEKHDLDVKIDWNSKGMFGTA